MQVRQLKEIQIVNPERKGFFMTEEIIKMMYRGSSAFQAFIEILAAFQEEDQDDILGENPQERIEELLGEMSEEERISARSMFDFQMSSLHISEEDEEVKPCLDSNHWYCIGDKIEQGMEMLSDDGESPLL